MGGFEGISGFAPRRAADVARSANRQKVRKSKDLRGRLIRLISGRESKSPDAEKNLRMRPNALVLHSRYDSVIPFDNTSAIDDLRHIRQHGHADMVGGVNEPVRPAHRIENQDPVVFLSRCQCEHCRWSDGCVEQQLWSIQQPHQPAAILHGGPEQCRFEYRASHPRLERRVAREFDIYYAANTSNSDLNCLGWTDNI